MPEEKLVQQAEAVTKQIKIALIERDVTQRRLSVIIGELPQQVSRAINGGMDPKSRRIRQKIYKVLKMEESE
ncbi:transcriptional regulator [Schleiferilactobacillus harbinensis]|uniref:Transcriptional regulator n=2 Tax=Schleiferilactobacillus harbinensis TaxID=304207 RepID=A0A5P8M594_9LACO|nr:hypothetical protein [Schleiferilactobacillus harbinensis]KRM26244.1 hypothetical protein FC91_GL000072 [Schleiferilactobacillus harbinensis DSM 16991]MCI1851870.1 transcriptional regulator [Schleiferilactobacillus harbinensis]QFR23670.1 transcriptional regulator [Schleiferilactobacillus harbinensis]QFR62527.1 transcriptional regulator [Schleiferilactobacillus harbinensis]QFR65388.1 transcriptional regulator [Schleiferilactobacillus harbinensis]